MKVQTPILALLSLVYGATPTDLSGIEGAVSNSRQIQDNLNYQLQASSGAPGNQNINAFITGTDSQIIDIINNVSEALATLSPGLSQTVGDFLLSQYLQSVTDGADVLLSKLYSGGHDIADTQLIGTLVENYAKLSELAGKSNVDSSRLQSLSQQISHAMSDKAKRDEGAMDGIKGAFTNFRQTIDTMKNDIQKDKGHVAQDTILAFITGADSQIDNAAATIAHGLNGVTLGISGEIGDFLLGPFVQAVTNGAEVVISNVIGGSIDIVTDGTAKLFSESLGKLYDLAVKSNVKSKDTEALSKVQKKVKHLKAPKKDDAPDAGK